MQAGDARPNRQPRSDLLHHVDAISRALKNWNDIEALRLLRLYWTEIEGTLRAQAGGVPFGGVPERKLPASIALPAAFPATAPDAAYRRPPQPFSDLVDTAEVSSRRLPEIAVSNADGAEDRTLLLTSNFQLPPKAAKYRS
jgi:hypothetical protein